MMEELHELFFGLGPIRAVQDFFGPGRAVWFQVLSLPGDTWGIVFVVGMTLWFWGRRPTYALLGAVVLQAGTKLLMTLAFAVPRPEGPGIFVTRDIDVASFPSGHVYEAVGPWTLLWLLGYVPPAVPALVAVAVSLGRLYLGLHYLGDVVAGVVLGGVFAWAYALAWRRVRGGLFRQPVHYYTAAGLAIVAGLAGNLALFAGDNPRRWELLGVAAGGLLGFLIEHRYVQYEPACGPLRRSGPTWRCRTAVAAAGLGGLGGILILGHTVAPNLLFARTLEAGLVLLWISLALPALLQTAPTDART